MLVVAADSALLELGGESCGVSHVGSRFEADDVPGFGDALLLLTATGD